MLDLLRCNVHFALLDGSLAPFLNHLGEIAASLLAVYIFVDKVWGWKKDAGKQHESEVKDEIDERTMLSDRTAAGWRGEWEVCRASLERAKEEISRLEQVVKERELKLVLRDDEIARLERKAMLAAEQHDSLVGKMDMVVKQIREIAVGQLIKGDDEPK